MHVVTFSCGNRPASTGRRCRTAVAIVMQGTTARFHFAESFGELESDLVGVYGADIAWSR